MKSDTLYVSDLDGTLLGTDSLLSHKSAAMLRQAIDEGALFTVATARTPATVSTLLSDVPLRLPAVVMTGAALWDRTCNTYRQPRFIAPEAIKKVMDVYYRLSFPAFIYTLRDGLIHIYHIGPLSPLEQDFITARIGNPYKEFHTGDDPRAELQHILDCTLLFYAMQPTEKTREAWQTISTIPGLNPIFYHDIFGAEIGILEVFSDTSSKAAAIAEIKRQTGAQRVVVFGDNINDLAMMLAADQAVAVGNALPEVKAAAHIVIGPNTSDSVAKWILSDC